MRRNIKFLALFALCLSFMSNHTLVHAAEVAANVSHQHEYGSVISTEMMYGTKTGEHEVVLNGLAAQCYIYTVGYRDIVCCKYCDARLIRDRTEYNVHSIQHL